MTNMYDDLVFFTFVVGLVLVILFGFGYADTKRQEKKNQDYTECKALTIDLEWCFKQFEPKLK